MSRPRVVSGVLEMKMNTTVGCQFLQRKFVVVLRGLCVFGIGKVGGFPPPKINSMWRALILHKHFLLIQLVREMGKIKTLYLSNKHLPCPDENQTLPLLMTVTRWHHVPRRKLSPTTTKPQLLLLQYQQSPSCSHSNHSHTTAGREVRAESDLNVYGENLVGGAAEPGFHQRTRIKQHICSSHSHFLTTPAYLQVFSRLCGTNIAWKSALALATIINLWEVLTRLSSA